MVQYKSIYCPHCGKAGLAKRGKKYDQFGREQFQYYICTECGKRIEKEEISQTDQQV